MPTRCEGLPSGRGSSHYWWLRVTLAAFVLSAWMTVALAGGVAHGDSPPPSDGATKSDTQTDTTKRSGGLHQRPTRHHQSESQDDRGTERAKKDAADTDSTTKPSARRTAPKPDGPDNQVGASADADTDIEESAEALPATPKSTPFEKPRPSDASRARSADRLLGLTAAAVKPLKALNPTAVASPRHQPDGATTGRNAPALQAQQSVRAVDPRPSAASIVPANPAPPSTSAAVDVPQLGRQATGLVSDVGVVAASVVYTVADTIAQAFGPNDFLGVPYALATALANTAAAAGRTLIGAPFDAAEPGRFRVTYGVLDGLSFFNPQKPPPGANDPDIHVTDEHPLPIILLNGTTATQGTNWSVGAPVLANAGYKVYTFNYGNVTNDPNSPIQATADIRQSADELDAEIDRVLEETGAEKVILIGHSQGGGILPAYYINNVDGAADKVSQVVGIAPSNHGTDFNGLVGLLNVPVLGPLVVAVTNAIGPAFIQQTVGSDFQQVVYGSQDTDPRVIYTNIITMNDEIVTPYTQQALEGDNVTNIVLQERYPGYPAGHLGVVLSPQVWSVVLEELEANPEANPQLHPQDSAELAA